MKALLFLSGHKTLKLAIIALVVVQAVVSLMFLYDLMQRLFNLRSEPLFWQVHEALEPAGVQDLLPGLIQGIIVLRKLRQEFHDVNSRLRVASRRFYKLVREEFAAWRCSPSEQDTFICILKGPSNAETADITGKKPGAFKTPCNAVLRKTGLANRSQFTSYFIGILMQVPPERA